MKKQDVLRVSKVDVNVIKVEGDRSPKRIFFTRELGLGHPRTDSALGIISDRLTEDDMQEYLRGMLEVKEEICRTTDYEFVVNSIIRFGKLDCVKNLNIFPIEGATTDIEVAIIKIANLLLPISPVLSDAIAILKRSSKLTRRQIIRYVLGPILLELGLDIESYHVYADYVKKVINVHVEKAHKKDMSRKEGDSFRIRDYNMIYTGMINICRLMRDISLIDGKSVSEISLYLHASLTHLGAFSSDGKLDIVSGKANTGVTSRIVSKINKLKGTRPEIHVLVDSHKGVNGTNELILELENTLVGENENYSILEEVKLKRVGHTNYRSLGHVDLIILDYVPEDHEFEDIHCIVRNQLPRV